MPVLDERFATAASELRDHLDDAPVRPPSGVVRRHRRRRYATGGTALATAALTVVAIGVVATGDRGGTAPAASTIAPAPESVEDSLLVPVGNYRSPEVSVLPATSQALFGLVASPGQTPILISVGSTQGDPDPDVQQFDVNGRAFHRVDAGDSVSQYASVDACISVGVVASTAGTATAGSDAMRLLESFTFADTQVALDLPAGWRSFGAGRSGPVLQLTYEYGFGDGYHTVTLTQAVNTPIAALPGIRIGPLVPAGYDGLPAWTMEWPGTDYRSRIWNDNGNAVMITSDVSEDQLLRHAVVDLFHGETFEWDGALDIIPEGTLPPGSEGAPPGCGAPSLTVTESAQSTVDVGSVDQFPAGSVTAIEDPGLFVVNDDTEGLIVFDARSTHLACPLVRRADLSPADEGFSANPEIEFVDPCHGSAWGRLGNRMAGPSPRELDRYGIDVIDGRLVVDLADLTPGRSAAIEAPDTAAIPSSPGDTMVGTPGTVVAPPAPATTTPTTAPTG